MEWISNLFYLFNKLLGVATVFPHFVALLLSFFIISILVYLFKKFIFGDSYE